MMRSPVVFREKGNALILAVIIMFAFLSGIIWFSSWGWNQSRTEQHSLAGQRAFQYADSGITSSRPWLKSPLAVTRLLPGSSTSYSLLMPSGRCDVALHRTSPDPSLVDAYSTGYYFIAGGTQNDPITGRQAQVSAIHAVLRITSLASYLVAFPGDLPVSYGAYAPAGIIYAQNLTFQPPTGPTATTEVGEADYLTSVSTFTSFVVFHSTPASPQKLAYPPVFATLDDSMRAYYQSAATTDVTPTFSGTVTAPSNSSIYFVNGDVDVAKFSPLNVNGVWVLYATGNIYIHNDVLATGGNWAAFLSEKDIHITVDAPDALTMAGNYVCNGTLTADSSGLVRSPGTIAFTGGLVIMSNIDLITAYHGAKTYTYYLSTDPGLKLPNVTDMLMRNVVMGSDGYK